MTMFRKYLFISLIIVGVIVGSVVFATNKDDIVFPVAELSSCQDEEECRAYCDNPDNIDECIAFAEVHNLLSAQEIEKARKFQSIGVVGPGECTSELECEAYCENVNNIEECLAFAEQHGFMDEEELEEAKKIAAALRAGAQLPGGCTSKEACEAYCEDPNNMRECIAFAEAAGFMSPEELREVKQVLKALDAGIPFPGGCRGEHECEIYCEDFSHIEECVEFGIAAGFIPPGEAEDVRRMIPLMKAGKMPAGCLGGREECEAYCAAEENLEECTTFFVEAGFMSAEEAKMFKETGGRGPGGCSGQAECEAFCNNPTNQQACFEFGREHGFISEEELHNIEQGTKQFDEGFAQAPPEVELCLKEKVGEDVLLKIEAGTFLPTPELGEHMRYCFEEFFPRPEGGEFGPPPGFEEGDESFFPQQFEEGPEGFFPPEFEHEGEREFIPQEFRNLLPEGLENLAPHEIEQIIREQQEQEFELQFQQEQFKQFEQLIPQFSDEHQGELSPEDVLRIEQEEEAFRLQLEQIQQEQLPLSEDTTQGNILEAAGRFLQRLFGR